MELGSSARGPRGTLIYGFKHTKILVRRDQRTFKNIRTFLKQNMVVNINIMEIQNFEFLDQNWKRRAPQNDDGLTNSRKSWKGDQYLAENMKWTCCIFDSIEP